MPLRDRVKELRRVRARDLVPHPKNWRTHPEAQKNALRGLLAEVGIVDALIGYDLPDGRTQLIDGHLRQETEPDETFPVLVLDVTPAEADKVLVTLDPLAAMAEADAERLAELLAEIESDNEAVEAMLADPGPPRGRRPGPDGRGQ